MDKKNIYKLAIYQIFIFSLIFCLPGFCQINNTVFQDDFESSPSSISALWLPAANYSVTTGLSGNGVLFNSTTSNTNLTSSANIPIANLSGTTIVMSANIKGENLTGSGNPGMVIQLVAKTSSGTLRYYRIPVEIGSFDWKLVGRTLSIDSDIVSLSLNIGIYNATGKLWLDNILIQAVSEAMPPARDQSIAINKTHKGMYRGMNVRSNSIKKSDLDELSYDWKANSIRCQIGGNQYTDGLLRSNYESILQTEMVRMDTLVKWCTANDLHMIVGLAGLSQGLFANKAAQTKLVEAWKLIAARYKDSDIVWAYDLANEPIASQYPYSYPFPLDKNVLLWPSLADTLVKSIRKIDGKKAIIIESLNYSIMMDDIKPIDPSIPNIIYSVHMYVPHQFTHQQFSSKTPSYSYPGTIDGKYYDKSVLRQLLQPLKNYQDKYRVPIYIGEFSCIRWAPGKSSYNYIRDCIELFEEYKWDYSFHAFRDWDGWSVEHSTGWYDSVLPAAKTDRELLFRSYFKQNITQINYLESKTIPMICFPNPVNDVLHIQLAENDSQLMLYDIIGNKLVDLSISSDYKLNMSDFKSGIYFLKVENSAGMKIEKVVKK